MLARGLPEYCGLAFVARWGQFIGLISRFNVVAQLLTPGIHFCVRRHVPRQPSWQPSHPRKIFHEQCER